MDTIGAWGAEGLIELWLALAGLSALTSLAAVAWRRREASHGRLERALFGMLAALPLLPLAGLTTMALLHRVDFGVWPHDPFGTPRPEQANPLYAYPLLRRFEIGAILAGMLSVLVVLPASLLRRKHRALACFATTYLGMWWVLVGDPGGWISWLAD